MAKVSLPTKCIGCRKSMEMSPPFASPQVCPQCWEAMTPAEKASRQEAWDINRRLVELKHAVENNEYLAKQTARLAKVLESLLRELKEPFAGLSDLVERWNARIERAEREEDEGDEWKRGRDDDDE